MSMNTPIGNITQTTPIKNFKELDEMQNEQYLLGIDNNAIGNGSKISLENLINSSISADSDNLITKGTDDRLLVNTPIEIGDLSDLTTTDKSTLVAAVNEVDSDITAEATIRQNADNNLQSQIDAITAASDVTDIVGTYAQLQAYDTTGLPDNSIIKVLQDESRQNETTYYRWVITGGVGAWVLIGEEGPYYTISQSDSKFATQATVGNLSNLATSDKSSVVNAMNELASVLDPTQTADYIKNSKAIYSGEVSENALILPQIKEMARSTFDISKFTVVGSPNITDDGIASGFSGGNYIYVDNFSCPNRFVFKGKFKPTTTIAASQRLFNIGVIEDHPPLGLACAFGRRYQLFITSDNTDIASYYFSTDYCITLNIWNYYKFSYDGATYKLETSTDDRHYTTVATITSSESPQNTAGKLAIGSLISDMAYLSFEGEVDLKQFSLTVDGVEVFSGNKTGIDTIKPDDYTVVGTPAISADGIASGFSTSNYLRKDISANLTTQTLTIDVTCIYEGYCKPLYTNSDYWRIRAEVDTNSIAIRFSSDTVITISNLSIQNGDKVRFKLKLSNSGNELTVWQNDIQTGHNTSSYTSTSDSYNNITSIALGGCYNAQGYENVKLDLNAFKIYVDGNLVYQPCLKIPYTESKTGSKIVGVNYRERVNDMAEQFGFAPYYTLSDTDFTLPQGEIYGYIEKRARDIAHPVAQPFYRFSDEINEDEVRLEGAEVDKGLYLAIENDPYLSALCTAGSTADKICLPDFRGRVIYGDVASGYVEPELPNHSHTVALNIGREDGDYGTFDTAYNYASTVTLTTSAASASNSIYKDGGTVKTAGVKARWLCRWK